MKDALLTGLDTVCPDILNRRMWEGVGLALKTAGFPLEDWKAWTRLGKEYDPSDCDALWEDFYPDGSYIPLSVGGKLPGRRSLARIVSWLGVPGWRKAVEKQNAPAGTAEPAADETETPAGENGGQSRPAEEGRERAGEEHPPVAEEPRPAYKQKDAPDKAQRTTLELPLEFLSEDGEDKAPEDPREIPPAAPKEDAGEPAPVPPPEEEPTRAEEQEAPDEPEVDESWAEEPDGGPTPEWYNESGQPDPPRYADGLPNAQTLERCRALSPRQPEELIRGVLRRGHKMLLAGSSKAGKSFLLMELCVAIAEGREWLGFPCRRGRVLYVNLEIDPASAVNRFTRIYRAMGIPPDHACNVLLWNLRGHARPIDQLAGPLISRLHEGRCDAVILDPIYKVLTGDENSATEMSAFCNYLDAVCEQTGCAVIYCHHHSKGDQSNKRVTDRASGSGVFARDPDAQLDIIELEPDAMQRRAAAPGATAWRMESSLREFPDIAPLDFWFEYPLHRKDDVGALAEAQPPKRSR